MITQRKTIIPIFNYKLTIVIFDRWEELEGSIPQDEMDTEAAVRPYQDKLIQCEIDKAFTAGINYTDRKTCKAIYGEVCLPNTPKV